MLKNRVILLLAAMIGLALLAACGGASPTAAVEPTPTSEAATAEASGDTADDGTRTFVIVPDESTASYLANEEFFADALRKFGIDPGFGHPVGSTQEIEGQFQFDFAGGALGENQFKVNLPSLATDQSMRDNWIRDNALESNRYPLAEFVAHTIEGDLSDYVEGQEISFKLTGDMTIREMTQPLTFDVTATLEGDTLSGLAHADSRLTDWGITPPTFANTLTVADEFAIEVDFVAREQ